MKNLIKYLAAVVLLFGMNACNEPIPTQLIPVEEPTDNLDLQVVSPEPGEFVYNNGYDSTGITDVVPHNENYIVLSGIKYTANNSTFSTGIANAVFFDRRSPMMNRNGRVLGFRSRSIGRIIFDGDSASVIPARMRIMRDGLPVDTLLGPKYILRYKDSFHQQRPPFPYNSDVGVQIFQRMGREIQFTLSVPSEITGSVRVIGRRSDRNVSLELNWNAAESGKIDIIIGGIPKGKTGVFPLLKFKTKDDGFLRIPARYIQPIPFGNFDKIVVTFIRKLEKNLTNTHSLNDNFIAAQSIHNIIFKVQ